MSNRDMDLEDAAQEIANGFCADAIASGEAPLVMFDRLTGMIANGPYRVFERAREILLAESRVLK